MASAHGASGAGGAFEGTGGFLLDGQKSVVGKQGINAHSGWFHSPREIKLPQGFGLAFCSWANEVVTSMDRGTKRIDLYLCQ